MAIRDLEAFLRQAASNFDSSLDVSPGSPFDAKVIQPLARRVGIDPFSIDLSTFLPARLKQAYPSLATDDGDNITDLLIKPLTLLFDPIIREYTRIRKSSSLADPSSLTLEEADSLGGNFFIPRKQGGYARGIARLLFSKPQDISINQNNFVTSKNDLVFFPASIQSIRAAEMMANVTQDGLYYFDVDVVAEKPGSAYRIGPNELRSVANVGAVARVTNVNRFNGGFNEEGVLEYVSRIKQGLGEKSLVTLRGTAAKITEAFPEVNRLNVVGHGDPEMHRDVLKGGGLGHILASGKLGVTIDDLSGTVLTRRFTTNEVNFDYIVGAHTSSSFTITLVDCTPAGGVLDFKVRGVVDQNTIDIEDSNLVRGISNIIWMLRRNELTLSGIPGGILFPNTANGDLAVDDNIVHIGGSSDVYTKSMDLEEATTTLWNVFDDDPLMRGDSATRATYSGFDGFRLSDLGSPPAASVLSIIDDAINKGCMLRVQDGPNAGVYRMLQRLVDSGYSFLRVTPTPANIDTVPRRWSISDELDVDLVEPKETIIAGEDLILTQGSAIATAASGVDYNALGVRKGDYLRITSGDMRGTYAIIEDPLPPGNHRLRINGLSKFSAANVKYVVFRSNAAGIELPLVRIKKLELLDSSAQPQGSYIPYACPVDVQSRSFQNPARGIKHDLRDSYFGLVSKRADPTTKLFTVTAGNTSIRLYISGTPTYDTVINIPAGTYTVTDIVEELNTAIYAATGYACAATPIDSLFFGIRPIGTGYVAVIGGTARMALFGDVYLHTTADIVSSTIFDWRAAEPKIDLLTGLDAIQVIDGRNAGVYSGPFVANPTHIAYSMALMVGASMNDIKSGNGGKYFLPDVSRRVIVGSRSIGSARVFFLEPTSFEVNQTTEFYMDSPSGTLTFVPDPTLSRQVLPPLPGGAQPFDGVTVGNTRSFTSISQNFILSGVRAGDLLEIQQQALVGTESVPTVLFGAAGKTFVFSIDGGPDRTVVLMKDDPSIGPTDVTRQGAIEQINSAIGSRALRMLGDRLTIRADIPLVIRRTGTILPDILGNIDGYTPTMAFSDSDTSNVSPNAGVYTITDVDSDTLTVYPPVYGTTNWPLTITDQTYKIHRKGVQRTTTTTMAQQIADAGLFYADVELVSNGVGDAWNIQAGEQLRVTGYKSDGYRVATKDANLSFSVAEEPILLISNTILEPGVDDDPQNATQVTGQNIAVVYERSSTVGAVHNFITSDTERVVCSSPLGRHLIPHYVRYDFSYYGGSSEAVVRDDHLKYINGLAPTSVLSSSSLQAIARDRGASRVVNPITMLAVVHNVDRSVWVQRSQDSLSTGRLSAFIPDEITISRKTIGGL